MSINYVTDYNVRIRDWILKVKEKAKRLSQSNNLQVVECPVCEGVATEPYVNNDSLSYVRCRLCTLVFMNPRPRPEDVNDGFKGNDHLLIEYFQIVLDYFVEPNNQKPNPCTDGQLKDIYCLKPNGNLLDVGCSLGHFLHKAKFFYDVEGVEINPLTALYAARHFKVHTDFLHNLNLPPKYDIVTLNQILYGVPNPVSLLKDIHKILAPGGILYVNSPNADSLAASLFKGKLNHFYGYTSLNVFNRSSVETAAKLAGFAIASFRTEWLDIYTPDVYMYLNNPSQFLHRRNIDLEGYEAALQTQDDWNQKHLPDLGEGGNYFVAVLQKI